MTRHDEQSGKTAGEDIAKNDRHEAGTRIRGLSRRAALKGAGIGGAAVLLGSATVIGGRARSNGVWNHGQGEPYALWHDWHDASGLPKLVAAGTLAANPHNMQPWSFVVGTGSIDIYSDPGRTMPANDSRSRERTAGFGCVIENIVVAARAEGLDAKIALWPDSDGLHVARIDLAHGEPATPGEQQLAAVIGTRHSNRGPFARRSVRSEVLDPLVPDAQGGAEVLWITDPASVAELGDVYVAATQAIVEDEQMSAEAFSWFRNDRADIDRHRDGLTLDCQGLDDLTLFVAKILPAQSRRSGDAFWVQSTRRTHTATAHAYGIVRVDDPDDAHAWLAGGRLLEHVHLAATAAGLAVQHMNQVSERITRDAALGAPDRFGARWSAVTGVSPDHSLLAFRIGYPGRTAALSPRRALSDVIRKS